MKNATVSLWSDLETNKTANQARQLKCEKLPSGPEIPGLFPAGRSKATKKGAKIVL